MKHLKKALSIIAVSAVLLAVLPSTVGAEPSPGASYPAAHDNEVEIDRSACHMVDQYIEFCRLVNGPQWVNIDDSEPGTWLATGSWTLDLPDARPWLVVRDLIAGRSYLVSSGPYTGPNVILFTGNDDGYGTSHTAANGMVTRPEFRQMVDVLIGR